MTTTSLHVVIDARWIFPEISGIGLYTRELIAALARIDTPHRYTLLFNNEEVMTRTAAETGFAMQESFATELVGRGPFSPADQILLPHQLQARGVDVFHAPNYMMPLHLHRSIRRVVTIHDLIPLLFRHFAPRSLKNRLFPVFKWLMHQTAARADRIIAVSEATRQDVLQHLLKGRQPDKISVVYEAARAACKPAPKTGDDGVEFLFVGRRDPYKNLPMLIEALAEVRRRGLPARLRVVGGHDPRYPEAEWMAHKHQVNDAISWSGYVTEPGLVEAYQRADVYVLPSRYEGFGLPVLEAMACGTPVICSQISSLPEVAGDAAIYMNPDRLDSLVDAMCKMAADARLRANMAHRSLVQAARFSWDETARQTVKIYEAAAL